MSTEQDQKVDSANLPKDSFGATQYPCHYRGHEVAWQMRDDTTWLCVKCHPLPDMYAAELQLKGRS